MERWKGGGGGRGERGEGEGEGEGEDPGDGEGNLEEGVHPPVTLVLQLTHSLLYTSII